MRLALPSHPLSPGCCGTKNLGWVIVAGTIRGTAGGGGAAADEGPAVPPGFRTSTYFDLRPFLACNKAECMYNDYTLFFLFVTVY